MFRSSKFPFILLLLFSPLLTTCTENKSDSIGSATELDVILDPAITSVTTDQVESSILQFRIQGVKEPFFERVSIQGVGFRENSSKQKSFVNSGIRINTF
jgi:hypothetical protein